MCSEYTQWIIHTCLLSSILILVKRNSMNYLITTLLGVILYNVFNLHHRVIVPNYYSLRDWFAIAAGLIYLIAIGLQ